MEVKPSIYLDTSVLSFYFADDVPREREITREFFKEMDDGEFRIFISDVVIDEIDRAPEPKRSRLSDLVDKFNLKILPLTPEAENLANEYVKHNIVPSKYSNDAVHMAIAVVNNIYLIVSWNQKHMVKLKTIQGVNSINNELHYRKIDIRTPEEVLP